MIFDYPKHRAERRHGPAGYSTYESYRPWLRDEFTFRCIYCLKRETWGQVTSEFELDHFEPQSIHLEQRLNYFNLVYACRRCNAVKRDQAIADPFDLLVSERAALLSDGSIHSFDIETEAIIQKLDLNSPNIKKWRTMWLRIVTLAEEHDPKLFQTLISYPEILPDLRHLKPLENSIEAGIQESWFVKRERGELPEKY